MKPTINVGSVFGVRVGVHYSWFAIVAFFSWSLSEGLFPLYFPGWSVAEYWATGVVASLLFFASVLAHELAHSLVGKARGFQVENITLFILGGVSHLKLDTGRARDEFIVSAAGPATSLLVSAAFGAGLLAFRHHGASDAAGAWYLTLVDLSNTPAAATVWYLALINLLLAGFNLIPAYPLDGGRLLRSILWASTGSLSRATGIASVVGQAFGILLIALGALQVFRLQLLEGALIAAIGWFLNTSARSSRRETATETDTESVTVGDAMDANPATVGPDTTVVEAVLDHFQRRGPSSLPVCEGDRVVGIVTLKDIMRGVRRNEWGSTRVGSAMTPTPLWQVGREDELSQALAMLDEHSVGQAPVVEGGRLVGLLTRASALRHMR